MPIYLPPISRRKFLSRSLLASAGLLLGSRLPSQARTIDDTRWALVSDIHIAADKSRSARGVNMFDSFKAVTEDIIRSRKHPAAVLVSGDLAFNQGEPGDYANILDLLKPLRRAQFPVHLTLGNHDHREHFWTALEAEKTADAVANRQASLIRSARANWFVLDSLDKTRVSEGALGEAQLKWLAKSLDENSDKPALVVVHHNPAAKGKGALEDTDELFAVIRPRKQVKAYIFGHTHVWNIAKDESGIHLVNLPPTAYVFHEGKPNGWVLAQLKKNGMSLELRCLDQKHKQHGQTVDLKWRA